MIDIILYKLLDLYRAFSEAVARDEPSRPCSSDVSLQGHVGFLWWLNSACRLNRCPVNSISSVFESLCDALRCSLIHRNKMRLYQRGMFSSSLRTSTTVILQ